MAEREFKVRVLVESAIEPTRERPYVEDPGLAFSVRARGYDAALREARRRLVANRRDVRGLSCSPLDVLVAMVQRELLPPDAPGVLTPGETR